MPAMGPKALFAVLLICGGVLSAEGLTCWSGMGKDKKEVRCTAGIDYCQSSEVNGVFALSCGGPGKPSKGCQDNAATGAKVCFCLGDGCNKNGASGKDAAAFRNPVPVALIAILSSLLLALL